ncbi:hypothetical protein M9458_051558 [Cirrhinus mrigala]|uniref:Uncharacterized protein n=1 Tax=Cirrhinus mrigala TaxID=683832 RepID=A0ABD0MSZ2_CIRMR
MVEHTVREAMADQGAQGAMVEHTVLAHRTGMMRRVPEGAGPRNLESSFISSTLKLEPFK